MGNFAKKHKKVGIDWGIDTKDFEYFKLEDLLDMNGPDHEYTLRGLFINKNKPEKQLKEYGASPVGILGNKLINLPNHLLSEVEEILQDEEDIAEIKAGEVKFKIRSYESHGKTCYSPDWCE